MVYLITFDTQLDAVIARKKFDGKAGGVCKLQPIPRSLSSSCGTCAKVDRVNLENLITIDHEAIYSCENNEYKKVKE